MEPTSETSLDRLRFGPTVAGWGALAGLSAVLVARWVGRLFGLGPVDDAFITLRYATRWAAGEGLTYNPGERIEGYTNFLQLALEAAAARLSLDPVSSMEAIGLASLFALVMSSTLFLTRATGHPPWSMALFSVAVGTSPLLVCWSGSGMETCLYSWLVLASVGIALYGGVGAPVGAGLAVSLAAMARPEGVALAPVLAYVVFRRHSSRTEALRFIGAFLLSFGPYYLWRSFYFGAPFPLPFYAKHDFGGLALLARGASYVGGFLLASLVLAIPAAGSCLLERRPAPHWIRASALTLGTLLAIPVLEGGDHFAMYRFMVPALPFLAMLSLPVAVRLSRRVARPARAERLGVLGAAALVLLSHWSLARASKGDELPFRQLQRFALECRLTREWRQIGRWFGSSTPPGASIATVTFGAIGYESGRRIEDPHGLVDPVIARRKRALGSGTAGHEKYDVDYTVFEKRPQFLLLLPRLSRAPVAEADLPEQVWGEFNAAVLEHSELDVVYRYASVRTDFGFLNLHIRRD